MKTDGIKAASKRTFVYIAAALIMCVGLIIITPKSYHAKDIKHSPFKMLKIGSKNLTKAVNKSCYMAKIYDGCLEMPLSDFKGKVKKGSKLKYKLKKGYKAKFTLFDGKKMKKIKNKSKITWCAKDWAIYMTVQKGKYYIYYGFLSEYYD